MKEEDKNRLILKMDNQLVVDSQNGLKEAFGELVLRYQNYVMGYLVNRIKDRQAAEDLTQETFLRAYRSLKNCRNPEKFGSWLVGIAHNCLLEWSRQRRESFNVLEAEDVVDRKVDLAELEKKTVLHQVIKELPENLRKILEMKYIENIPCAEIARTLNKPVGTITGQLSRAYDILWEKLAKYWEESR